MEPHSLEGMAAFIRRICAQTTQPAEDDRPTAQTATTPPPDPQAVSGVEPALDPWAVDPEPPAEEPLYSQYAAEPPADGGEEADWRPALEALEKATVEEATVVGWNRGGLLVQWRNLQGFLPASQLQQMIRYTTDAERDAAFASRVGESLRLKAIEVDPSRKRLVFSERALQWGPGNGQCLWPDLASGQVRRGRVRNLCDFGAFIDLGGIDGLIHISELSWRHVRHPSEVLQIGQDVDVFVMAVEPERKRVALSLKKLTPDPWGDIGQRYHVGQIVRGVVTNVLSFGAFARIEDGVEGLIHVSELAEGNFLHPRNVIQEGDEVTVRVISFDSANRRLALSLRQVQGTGASERVGDQTPRQV